MHRRLVDLTVARYPLSFWGLAAQCSIHSIPKAELWGRVGTVAVPAPENGQRKLLRERREGAECEVKE